MEFSSLQKGLKPTSAGQCKDLSIQVGRKVGLTNITRYAGSIILSVIYGYDVLSNDDSLVKLVESTEQAFTVAPLPKWLVNGIPILRHIPSWLPGAGFKRYAKTIRDKWHQVVDVPFNYTRTTSEEGRS